jgi:DNA-binding MarR family transcriptional regulator
MQLTDSPPQPLFHRALVRLFRLHSKIVFGRLADVGVTQGQPRILHYLTEHDGCIQKDISCQNDFEPATVTNSLAVMERAGFIRRKDSADDRRILHVFITDKGREAYAASNRTFAEVEAVAFRGFSAKEREQALTYLGRLYDNLRS